MSALFEMKTSMLILLGIVVAIAAVLWSRARDRRSMIALGIAVLALGAYALLGWLIVTDKEKAEQVMLDVALKFDPNNLDPVFELVSEDFRYGGSTGIGKKGLRERAEANVSRYGISEVKTWEVVFQEFDGERGAARVSFRGKANSFLFHGEAALARESDGKWRITTFKIFKPGVNEEFPLP